MINRPSEQRIQEHKKIDCLVQQFLAKGGKIKVVEFGKSAVDYSKPNPRKHGMQ